MHEFAIAQEIVNIIQSEAEAHKLKQVDKARLKVGRMAAFQPEHLQMCFEACERSDILKEMKLEIEEEAVELECEQCHHTWTDERFDDFEYAHQTAHDPIAYELPPCPKCKAQAPKIIGGNGIHLVGLEGE